MLISIKLTRFIRLLTRNLFLFGIVSLSFSSVWANEMPVLVGIGGDFTAVDSNNEVITETDLKGKPVLMAFGYTNCADICPITVAYMRTVYEQLTAEEQTQVRFVFVTVDPEYDTPAHLKAFLAHFNSDFIGITGSRVQLDKIVENYKVDYQRLSSSGVSTKYIRRIEEKKKHEHKDMVHGVHDMKTETMSDEQTNLYTHSAHLFVIDKDMQTRSLAHTGTPRDELVIDLRSLIAE